MRHLMFDALLFLTSIALISADDYWFEVQKVKGKNVMLNLETTPLEVKTDLKLQSLGAINAMFYTIDKTEAGSVDISFQRPNAQYRINKCMDLLADFPKALSPAADKVFRITLTRTTVISIQIQYNGVEVVNVVISDSICSSNSGWQTVWNRKVAMIQIAPWDDASKFYRAVGAGVQPSVVNLGCWADVVADRAIASLEGEDPELNDDYNTRTDPYQKCLNVAKQKGYEIFALQNGGWCAGSATASSTYEKYGESTNCAADGEGGGDANQVYKIILPDLCEAPTIANGKVSPSTAISPGSSYTVICNGGFNLKGNSDISCTENNGKATLSTSPTCQKDLKCEAPTIGDGKVSPSTAISPGSSYTVTCNGGFNLKGNSDISCTENNGKATLSTSPTCQKDAKDEDKTNLSFANCLKANAALLVVLTAVLLI